MTHNPKDAVPEPIPEPESSAQDGDARLLFERRYRLPPGARLVTAKPGQVTVVIGAGGMKPDVNRAEHSGE